jgi:hypothetical protein
MIDRSNNPNGYDRVLPGRMTHDHCAVDTPKVLSYCRGAIVNFGVVGVVSSHRFWGPVQCSRDFFRVPTSRGGCQIGNGRTFCNGPLDATINEDSSNGY